MTTTMRLIVLVLTHGLCIGLAAGPSRAEESPIVAVDAPRYRQAANLLDEKLKVQVTPLDAQGNEVHALGAEEPTTVAPSRRTHGPAGRAFKRPRRAFYARWYTYAGLATLSGGAGLYFALASRADAREQSKLRAKGTLSADREADELEERSRRNSLFANVGFGAAGLSTVAAIFCAFRESRQDVTMVLPMASKNRVGMSMRRAF